MTLGELGIAFTDQKTTPEQMAEIRYGEFISAMAELGFGYEILALPDLGLSSIDFSVMVMSLLSLFRTHDFASIFAFAPDEFTPLFDHPDHTKSGEAARYAAMATNVGRLLPESPAIEGRPELYLRRTEKNRSTHQLPLTSQARERRDAFLIGQYPSQFSQENHAQWSEAFDQVHHFKKQSRKKFSNKDKKQTEYYQRIR